MHSQRAASKEEVGSEMNPLERIEKFFLANMGQVTERELPYDPRPTDVIVVGPAKSGTTWLQQILHQIRMKGDENFDDIYMVTWWLPYKCIKYEIDLNAEQVANPRIYKSHDSYEFVPKTDGMKFVVITRDPYDCQWSFIKFFLRFNGAEEDVGEELALDLFQLGQHFGNDYFGILTTWYEHRNDPNVLWIHYEDLKSDLRFCIQKMAEFLGKPLSDAELARVHDFCTFDYMSKHENRFGADVMLNSIAKAIEAERWNANCHMVRPDGGKVGQGRKNIGPKLREVIEQRWADTVKKELGFSDYNALLQEASFLKKHGRQLKL